MNRPKIVAHCQVKNEELWVWYAIMSVLEYVDEILVWDTGSTDQTVEIVKSIRDPKVKYKQAQETPDETTLSMVRTQMIQASKEFDWMLILDGDEIWLEKSLKQVVEFLAQSGTNFDGIVTPTLNCVGDVFHVLPADAGKYHLLGKVGHFNIRFINLTIPGLHVANPPGKLLSYLDKDNHHLYDSPRLTYLNAPYLHTTHLARTADRRKETSVFWRAFKKKYELGLRLPHDFKYPKCFYVSRPAIVRSPFVKRDLGFLISSALQTPLRKIKRQILK